jgi:hypothetical protein
MDDVLLGSVASDEADTITAPCPLKNHRAPTLFLIVTDVK